MPYGEIRVDTITFTNGGADKSITVSGLFASTSGNLTVTGTVSGVTANFASGNFSTRVSGLTVAGTTGTFTTLTGTTINTTTGIFPAGSQTAPSVQVGTGTTNNPGLYSPGTDQLAISTNGTGRLFVDASGNVGLNTTPSFVFDALRSNAGTVGRFRANGTDANVSVRNNAREGIIGSDTTQSYLLNADAFPWTIWTNNLERARIRADGTFEVKGGGTAGVNPAVSVNPSASANSLVIDSSGRVGLGTSSPSYLLHLNGTSNVEGRAITSGASSAAQWGAQNTTGGTVVMGAAGSSYTPYGVIGVSNAYVYTGSDLAIATDGANVIKFATGAGIPERMRIDSAGRVGIGTASPATALQVVGTGTFGNGVGGRLQVTTDSNLSYIDSLNNAATQWQPLVERATEIQFHTNTAGVTPAQKAVIDSSGRLLVGLSSTSAAAKVVVQGNSAGAGSSGIQYFCFDGATPANNDGLGYLIFGDNTQARGAWIAGVRDGGTWSASSNPSRLEFSTTADGASSPTERMRIGQNGNVNIGRTSDLTVAPRVSIENSNYALALNTTNGGSNEAVRFYNAGTAVGTISTNGSATAYNTSSDYRLKENIVPLTNAVNRLNQLQVHRFNFIADSDKTVDGFIAHEAQAVVPECVTGTKDEVDADGNPIYQGIDQSKLVPLLTAALQEALAEIESLKARVTALEP